MEKFSLFCKRAMLGILLLLLLLALALLLRRGLAHRSYLAALAAGSLWIGALYALRRRGLPVPRRAGLWAMAVCAAVNLPWVLLFREQPVGDYQIYWELTCALAAGAPVPDVKTIAAFPHLFGTASFLSVFVRLFGPSVLAVTVLNVLWSTLSCGLVFLLGRKACSDAAGFYAALFWALLPSKLLLGNLVFSEPIYTLLLLLFFYLFWCLSERLDAPKALGPTVGLAALGLLLAAINFIRPLATILLIALWIWALFLRGDRDGKSRLRSLAALLALTLLYSGSLALWRGHLEAVLGEETASVPWYNIYVGLNEETGGQYSEDDINLLFSYYVGRGQTANEAQQSMIPHVRERLASVRSLPRLLLTKLFTFLGQDELGGYIQRFRTPPVPYRLFMVASNAVYYGVFLAALVGLARMLRSRRLSVGLLMPLFFIGLTLAHLLVEVTARYHYSLMPLLCLFAGLGLAGGTPGPETTPGSFGERRPDAWRQSPGETLL